MSLLILYIAIGYGLSLEVTSSVPNLMNDPYYSGFCRQLRHQQPAVLLPEALVLRGAQAARRSTENFRRQEVAIPGNTGTSVVRPANQPRHHHLGQLGHWEDEHHLAAGAEQLLRTKRFVDGSYCLN